ncbi:MAG: aminotransferase class I/II-fold pyridoxal phosphate-dependent enzyme [Planctomycetes bacterium]|jgi:aspartate aminotransferase/aminotransferase|nr:aminotransferase class I/II-fold pyridoxal phosphate-dependent enzyme [Planctomycetota bacterium]HPY75055.1 aminotransferase class I/II-fold pyridoxal phosphate-dependent enzyme [Planctomycetota bacterium]HQB00716.1 aminotransferase class I/II-fold pyridoxal phosphate-dependent enzyme [Planctomycetota bacterium]
MFAERVKDISVSGIRKVFDLAAKIENPVNFSIGQADYDVPEPLKQAAIEAIQKGCNRYSVTQGIEPLRNQVREHLLKTREYNPENIFITSGTSGGLLLAMLVLINLGDEVLLPDPYFVMYKNLILLTGGVVKYYDLYPDFQIKPEKIEEQITDKTKLIILNNPSNPTGAVTPLPILKQVAEIARKHDLIIISDEIYDEFVYDGTYHSMAPLYPEKTLLLAGYSKTYAMPGWRMGYAAGPKSILDKMLTLQQFSFVCAPTPAQYACVQAFDLDMSSYIESYRKKRDMIYNGIKEIGYNVQKPQGSFYMFPEIPKKYKDADEFIRAALDKEMLIIPGGAFSRTNTNFRISFAVTEETIERGLKIFKELL